MYTLYILALEQKKYFVGSTRNLDVRYRAHQDGHGATWTRKFKVIGVDVAESRETLNEIKSLELRRTLQMMMKYGVNSTRGACFCEGREYTWRDRARLAQSLHDFLEIPWDEVNCRLDHDLGVVERANSVY